MIRKINIKEFSPSAGDIIWDVRDAKAYHEAHLDGAENKPLDTLTPELLASVPDPVYVLCGGGSRAGKAATKLDEFDAKRDIVILQGGTRGAKACGLAVVPALSE